MTRTGVAWVRAKVWAFLVLAPGTLLLSFGTESASAQNCELYPIGISAHALSNALPGDVLADIYNGTQPGNFGWLSWSGSPSEPALVNSLTPPGDSARYVNPRDYQDRQIDVGDWVQSKPGVSNSKKVRDALNALKTVEITVPVWNETRGHGANAEYRVSAFARVRLLSYQLPQENGITARFLGFVSCNASNIPPVVNAGPDRSILASQPLYLTGSVSDDGLPAGGVLSVTWSSVSGPGTVTFSATHATNTTVQFGAPGLYVLALTANDSELGSTDEVVVTVNRDNVAPVIESLELSTDEDTPVGITLTGSDPDGDPLTFAVDTLPSYGQLSGTSPQLVYTPALDFAGEDRFTFRANDGQLDSSNAVVRIIIQPVNDLPVADSLSLTNYEDNTFTIALSGSDVEGSPLSYTVTSMPTNGVLSGVVPNLTYQPTTNFYGLDELRFTVNDGTNDSLEGVISFVILPQNDFPLVDAGPDQIIVLPTNSVSLNGGVIYDDFPGWVEAVEWRQLSGPEGVLFDDPLNETTTATFSQSGVYELQLWATDSFLFAADEIVVTVNAPPVVSAGVSQTNTLPASVTLSGTAFDDGVPTNGTLTTTWSRISGPGTVVFDDFHSTNTTASFSEGGTYVLQLSADDGFATSSSEITVVMNRAPVVDAGPDQVLTNLQTTLVGSVFDDGLPAGSLVSTWSKGSGPGTVFFSSPGATNSSAATAVMFSETGVYVLRLAADDSHAVSSDEIIISVNAPPVVDAGPDRTVTIGDDVLVQGEFTDDGIPNGSADYQWAWVESPGAAEILESNELETRLRFFETGTYVLRLTVNDTLSVGSDDVAIRVLPVNRPPVVSLGPKQVITLPGQAQLRVDVTDDGLPEGAPITVLWAKVSGPGNVAFSDPSQWSTLASFSTAGTYLLRFTASDSALEGMGEVAVIVRDPAQNQPPVVDAGSDRVVGLTNRVSLVAAVTDDGLPEGGLSTAWTMVSGPGAVSFESPHTASTAASFSALGDYVLRITVNDSEFSRSDDVRVTVYPYNQPPEVDAGVDQVVVIPDPAMLTTDGAMPLDVRSYLSTSLAEAPRWEQKIGQPGLTEPAWGNGITWIKRNCLDASGGMLVAGGSFRFAGTNMAKGVARWDGNGWGGFYDTNAIPDTCGHSSGCSGGVVGWVVPDCTSPFCTESTEAVAARGQEIFIAGFLKDLGNLDGHADMSARFDGARWWSWAFKQAGNQVRVIKTTPDKVYVGGYFAFQATNATSQTISNLPWSYGIAVWDGTNWGALGSGITDIRDTPNASVPGLNVYRSSVTSLAVASNGDVYVAGDFLMPTAAGIATNVAKWNGISWERLGDGLRRSGSSPSPTTGAAVAANGDFYVGGDFDHAGTVPVRNVARWDGSRWWALGDLTTNGVNGAVEAITVQGHEVYVGGSFSEAGGVSAWRVAKWNGQFWSPLGIGTDNGVEGGVFSLASDESGVYVGGGFTKAGGKPANNIAKWAFPRAPARNVVLQGRVTDDLLPADGELSVRWSKVSGPGEVMFENAPSAVTAAAFTQPGTYVVRLTADDTELTTLDEATVLVKANRPPIVAGGPDYAIGLDEPLTIEASVTDDGLPENVQVYVSWSVVNGPGQVTIDHRDRTNIVARFSQQGTYVLRLYANDSQFTVFDDVTVIVRPRNQPPSIYPGSGGAVTFGNTRQMNAHVTDDGFPNGVVKCLWSMASGPGQVTFSDPTATNAVVSFSTNGAYVLRLTANDSELSSSANVSFTVGLPANAPPVVSAGPDRSITNLFTRLEGTVSDDGKPWASALNTYWQVAIAPGTVTFANSNSPFSTVTFGRTGNYTLRLNVSDGVYHESDTVQISVLNQPPIVNAGPDRAITWPSNQVLLAGQVIDSSPFTVSWMKVSGPGTVTFSAATSLSGTARFSTTGTYVLRLRASDAGVVYSDEVTVVVATGSNQAPQVNAGENQAIYLPTNSVVLQGSVTDDGLPVGSVVSSRWTKIIDPDAVIFDSPELTNSTALNPVVLFETPGLYTFRLTGNDSMLTNGDDVTITVRLPINELPSIDLLDSLVTRVSDSLLLESVVTDDALPSGGALNGVWKKISGPGAVVFSPAEISSSPTSEWRPGVTAGFHLPGTYLLRFAVDDSEYSRMRDVAVTVLPADDNLGPVVNAGADASTVAFQPFIMEGLISDDGLPEGLAPTFSWSVASGPGRVYFSDANSLNPYTQFTAAGTYVMRLVASDGRLVADDTVTITVQNPVNSPPFAFAGLPMEVTRPNPAYLQGLATDDDLPLGYSLSTTWSVVSGPGTVRFDPHANDPLAWAYFSAPGDYVLRFSVGDSQFIVQDEVTVQVHEGLNQMPEVNAGPDSIAVLREPAPLHTQVTDDGLPAGSLQIGWTSVAGAGPVYFSTLNGVYQATFTVPGSYVLRLTASDGALTNSDDVEISVVDVPPPVAVITSPADGEIITSPAEVFGSAESAILRSYHLEMRLKPADVLESGSDFISAYPWTPIALGSNSLTDNLLGTIDPTLALNGIYELRLTVVDQAGRSVVTEARTVIFDRNLKLGHFAVSFNDLAIPVPGLPLQITRTYDSRAAAAGIHGDFGVGWTMDIRNVRLQKNRPLGRNWDQTVTGSPFNLSLAYHLDPGKARLVTITFPDGRVEKFQFSPYPMDQALLPIVYPQWRFLPIGNTRGTLVPAGYDEPDGRFLIFTGSVPGVGDLLDLNHFSENTLVTEQQLQRYPTLFRYTSPEGHRYLIDEIDGLQSVTDPNGNTLLVGTHGLTWSNPAAGTNSLSIAFQRDGDGRITNIVDAAGHSLRYEYDASANLMAFVSRDSETNRFTYDAKHRLLTLTDARGIQILENGYDGEGRLIATTDALGHSTGYRHDLEDQRQYITNRLGFVTVNEFDQHGNVVRTTDPTGAASAFLYDENGNLLVKSNAVDCACAVSYGYDSDDNRISETDAEGNTTSYTYNSLRKVVTLREPSGFTTTNSYDLSGNLISTGDAAGQVTTFTYNSLGKVTSMTDPKGTTYYGYDSHGFLIAQTNALGHVTEYTVDSNGNPLSQTITQTRITGLASLDSFKRGWLTVGDPVIPAPPVTNSPRLVMRYEYTPGGLPLRTLYYDGSISEVEYENGKSTVTTDQLGRQTTSEYNPSGQLRRKAYPGGCFEEFEYDAEGQLIASTDKRGFTTRFEYDPRGKLVRTRFADGSEVRAAYYADGSLLSETSKSGEITTYTLDGNRNRIAVTDASGTNHYTYNYRGHATSQVDPLNRTNVWEYDALARNIVHEYPDGSRKSATFSGKLVASETDQNGETAAFVYDAVGRMVEVSDALGGSTRYTYDEEGNRTSQSDALGRTTYFEYDSMRRLVRTIYPDASTVGRAYDAAGRLTAQTNQLGDVTVFEYDPADNLITTTDSLGHVTRCTYDCGGNKLTQTDPDGRLTRFEYDALSRLVRTVFACDTVESNVYDLAGRLISRTDQAGKTTLFDYDLQNRLIRVTDPLGDTTRFGYDATGNRIAETNALGQVTLFQYDGLNRLVRTTYPDQTNRRLAYDATGRVRLETDQAGKVTGFGYDAIGRLIATTNASGQVTRYGYNAVGERTWLIDTEGQTTRFTYDLLSRLVRTEFPDGSGQSTTYDKAGLPVTATDTLGQETIFEFDAAGRRTGITDPLGHTTRFAYDAMGRLAATTDADGRITRFNYDCMGRLAGTIFADGSSASAVFDAAGRRTSETDPNGNVTRFGYDDLGRMTSRTDALTNITSFGYDSLGWLVSQTDALGRVTTFHYDALGRLIRTIFPDNAFETATYDAKGRRLTQTDPEGHTTAYAYDDLDRLVAQTNALGHVTQFAYDSLGRLVLLTDANAHVTAYAYDVRGRLATVTYHDGTTREYTYDTEGRHLSETDQAGVTKRFTYDDLGRLSVVTDALNQDSTFAYDSLGRIVAQTDANGQTTRFEYDSRGRRCKRILPGGQSETFGYDRNGNFTHRTNFSGHVTTHIYDPLNRLTAKMPDPVLLAAGQGPITFAYNAVSRRVAMSDSGGTNTFAYDLRDRLVGKVTPQGALTYTRDLNGNVTRIQSSNTNGVVSIYGFDAVNRLTSVDDGRLGATAYGYDPVGNLVSATNPNGLTQWYSYNDLDRLTDLRVTNAQLAEISRYQYTLEPAGHRLAVAENLSGSPLHAQPVSIYRTNHFNPLYRLTGEQLAINDQLSSIDYSYDAVGNRLTRTSTVSTVPTTSHSYDTNDWLAGDSYDLNGNTTNAWIRDPFSLTTNRVSDRFDFEDRLIRRETIINGQPAVITVVYDGDGNRIAKTVTTAHGSWTTKYLVDDQNPTGYAQVVEELTQFDPQSSDLAVTKVYTIGNTRISEEQLLEDGGGGLAWVANYFGVDGHGSVRYLTEKEGAITDTWDYDAFGNVIDRRGSTPNLFLHAGEQFDPDLNLYYLRARYADPDRGRFWTADQFEGFADDPASWHRYTFNQNDPVNRLDPSGHVSLSESMAVSTLAPMVRGMAMQLFDGLNNYSHGLAGGSALKATSRTEAYMIDSLAVGPGWQMGKQEFWATAKGAPFLLANNPNIATSAKKCGYECIPFDMEGPIYGPHAAHPIFELDANAVAGWVNADHSAWWASQSDPVPPPVYTGSYLRNLTANWNRDAVAFSDRFGQNLFNSVDGFTRLAYAVGTDPGNVGSRIIAQSISLVTEPDKHLANLGHWFQGAIQTPEGVADIAFQVESALATSKVPLPMPALSKVLQKGSKPAEMAVAKGASLSARAMGTLSECLSPGAHALELLMTRHPRLNPFNYHFPSGRPYSGIPIPEMRSLTPRQIELALSHDLEKVMTRAAQSEAAATSAAGRSPWVQSELDLAAKMGLATGADEAVFWSGIGRGGDARAAAWAAQNGGATLESTLASRGITLPAWDASNPAIVAAWRQASVDFAAGARGNVRVLQGDALRVDAIWREEFRALQSNPNVNTIRAVNPDSGAGVLLWSR